MKKSELLKTEHDVQQKWLKNQIAKIANDGALSFSNSDVAERAFSKMMSEKMGQFSGADIEHFVSTHLSEIGTRKLVTTLRVNLKRSGSERLQVELTRTSKSKLDLLVESSGKTKIQIINQLIGSADLKEFKRPEDQLELTV